MKKKDVLVISLLSVVAVLLAVLTFQLQSPAPAQGQAAGAGAGNYIMATGAYSSNSSCCYIFDTSKQKLVVYGVVGTKLRGLIGARICTYDFNPKLIQYPSNMSPSVKDIQRGTTR
jgi:hypothetical protein